MVSHHKQQVSHDEVDVLFLKQRASFQFVGAAMGDRSGGAMRSVISPRLCSEELMRGVGATPRVSNTAQAGENRRKKSLELEIRR